MAEHNTPTHLIHGLRHTVMHFIIALLSNGRVLLPEAFGTYRRETAARIAYLAALGCEAMCARRLLTKRDIYYMCRVLFPSVAAVDRALHLLEAALGAKRNDLNIVSAPKGIVCGRVSFTDEFGATVNVAAFHTDGVLVPARPERLSYVRPDAHAILVYGADFPC